MIRFFGRSLVSIHTHLALAALLAFTACGDSPEKAERRRAAAEKIGPLTEEVKGIVDELIRDHFPELKGIRLTYKPILLSDVFLATDVETATIFKDPIERDYVLYLNAYLVDNHPGPEALRGIMAHELAHFSDYLLMNAYDLVVLYFQTNYNDSFTTQFERDTDIKAMERGFARGIRAYRVWIYDQLDDEAELAKKKRRYLQPHEIDAWIAANPRPGPN